MNPRPYLAESEAGSITSERTIHAVRHKGRESGFRCKCVAKASVGKS